jgi:site-specific DNA-cytosine methylase
MLKTAQHRPAIRHRNYRHDEYTCVDLFSGFGGLTLGIILAGFTAITAANHNAFKVAVHEANHPDVEHWIADLANPESSDYHSAADLPAADLLVAGVTCTNHTIANTQRAYLEGLSLFDVDDPDWEEQATRSERDRATATCVLQYAGKHLPKMILIECTTELQSWGYALPGKRKIGDGTTFRWWLHEHEKLGYKYKILYLNSMFFGVPQSRDRLYIVFWLESLPAPDLEHRPAAWCGKCQTEVEACWTWKTGVPPTGQVRWGVQYIYRCPSCTREVIPGYTPSLYALDLSNLGTRIGDRERDLAPATMARAERCLRRFGDFPAVLLPAKGVHGSERHPWQPMATQTSQQETALLHTGMVVPAHRHNGDGQPIDTPMDTVTSTHEKALLSTGAILQMANSFEHPGSECRTRDLAEPLWTQLAKSSAGLLTPPVAVAVDNYQGGPRGAGDPLPTQAGSETLGILSARVMPNRTHGTSRSLGEPMETLVGAAGSGGLGILSSGILPYRRNTVPTSHAEAMPTITAEQIPGLITAAGRVQCNGSLDEAKYRAYPLDRPLGTVVGSATTQGLLFSGWFKQNGSHGNETAPHPVLDPFGTLTSADTTGLLTSEWREALANLTLEDCYFRMLAAHEVGRGCGFDVDFAGHKGSFIVWGSARNQVDGFGNAVSPQVGEWIGLRLRAALHGEAIAA